MVPSRLDKALKWRNGATPFLDTTLVLAPAPSCVATLPNRKLPDRADFTRHGDGLAARVKAWSAATSAAQQLADEFDEWVEKPDLGARSRRDGLTSSSKLARRFGIRSKKRPFCVGYCGFRLGNRRQTV